MSNFLELNTGGRPGCKFGSLQTLRSFLGLAPPYRSCLASARRGRNAPHCSNTINREIAGAVEGLLSDLLITAIPSAGACGLLETLLRYAVCGQSHRHQKKIPELRDQWLDKLWAEYLRAHGLDIRRLKRPVGPLANDTWESALEVARGLEYGVKEAAVDDYVSEDRDDDDGLDDSESFDDGGVFDDNSGVLGDGSSFPGEELVLTPDTTITDFSESASQETEKGLELQEIGHEQMMRASLDDLYHQVAYENAILDPHGQEEEDADVEVIGSAEEEDEYEETNHLVEEGGAYEETIRSAAEEDGYEEDHTHDEAISPAEDDHAYVEATQFAEEEEDIDQEPIILGEEKDTCEETNHLAEEEDDDEEDTCEEAISSAEEEEDIDQEPIILGEEKDTCEETNHLTEDEGVYEKTIRSAKKDAPEETNSPATFDRYCSKPQSPLAQLNQLLNKVTETVPHTGRCTGYIYAFARPSLPGFLKIGFVEEKDKANRPYTDPVDSRLARWKAQCGQPVTEVFRRHIDCNGVNRIESLVHLTLKEYRRVQAPPCQPCEKRKETAKSGSGGNHKEWFEIDPQTAERVVHAWASFAKGSESPAKESPYDAYGRLDDFWTVNIDAEKKRIADTTITRSRSKEPIKVWFETRMQRFLEENDTRLAFDSILSERYDLFL
ncbi:hypothetical protein QBC43DRAFT_326359 [Cladorrhinum sp. PSN259]|nr:hypothetical protein QBC43DRAFT_326359 [Cladorrhinum sp. PSN259]